MYTGKQRSLATGRQYWDSADQSPVLAGSAALPSPAPVVTALAVLLLEGGGPWSEAPSHGSGLVVILGPGVCVSHVMVTLTVGLCHPLGIPQSLCAHPTSYSHPELLFPRGSSFLFMHLVQGVSRFVPPQRLRPLLARHSQFGGEITSTSYSIFVLIYSPLLTWGAGLPESQPQLCPFRGV